MRNRLNPLMQIDTNHFSFVNSLPLRLIQSGCMISFDIAIRSNPANQIWKLSRIVFPGWIEYKVDSHSHYGFTKAVISAHIPMILIWNFTCCIFMVNKLSTHWISIKNTRNFKIIPIFQPPTNFFFLFLSKSDKKKNSIWLASRIS